MRYKDQSVNAVHGDNHCSMLVLYGTHIHCVWARGQVFTINVRYANTKQEA